MVFRKILIAILTQVPLATGIFAWRKYVVGHYVLVALLAAAYEICLLVAGFGKKVWAKIEDRLVQSTADWIVKAVNNLAPNFRRRYYRQIVKEHDKFTVTGLVLVQSYRLRLEQVFVDLRIDSSSPLGFNIDPIKQKDLAGSRSIWDFLTPSVRGHQPLTAFVIVGPPGSGKTTLLKHLALSLATSRQRRQQTAATVPLLFYLRDHIQAITQDRPSIGTLAQEHFGNPNSFASLKTPQNWFQNQLERDRCLVMLDGLDEVAEPQQRKAVSQWVDAQIRNYPGCRFILTARPQGYLDAPLELADMVLEVRPFNADQVKKFVENWYFADEVMRSQDQRDSAVKQQAAEGARNLLQRLRDVPTLSALTVNPLLLTMIAMVHRYRGALPGSRVELYAEICEVLLERWRQTRSIPDRLRLKASQKLVVLRHLAAHMMEFRVRDIKTQDAVTVVSLPLERVGATSIDALTFLKDIQGSSGLLLEREANQWSFAHLTFQEYLTSVHWLDQKSMAHDWRAQVNDSWWHETLRLYAGQTDASALVKECLAVNTIPTLMLAADFLDESRELDPKIRDQVEDLLIAGLESTDSDRWRLAAEVHLSRRLRSFQRIDDRRAIDSTYLTRAEYQLFLDTFQAQERYLQPSHWTTLSFQSDEALTPICGVTAEEAIAFCDWLSQRQGGTSYYRLPEPEEVLSNPTAMQAVSAWCLDQRKYAPIGLEESTRAKIEHQLAGISKLPLPSTISPQFPARKNPRRLFTILFNVLRSAIDRAKVIDITHSDRGAPPSLNANKLGRIIQRLLSKEFVNDILGARDLAVDLLLSLDGSLGVIALSVFTDTEYETLERILKRDVARASQLVKDLHHIHEISRYKDLDLVFASDLMADIKVNFDHIEEVLSDIKMALGKETNTTIVVTLAIELVDILALNVALCPIILAIDNHDQTTVTRLARVLIPVVGQSKEAGGRGLVFKDVFKDQDQEANTRLNMRKSFARTLERVYLGYQEITQDTFGVRWRHWLNFSRQEHDQRIRQRKLLDYYWRLNIVSARQEGILPCWEGIRVVREEMELSSKDNLLIPNIYQRYRERPLYRRH